MFRRPFCFDFTLRDPGGARTLDPMIKSHLLYQLSYQVLTLFRVQSYAFIFSLQVFYLFSL